jgi:hypothetical protein
MTDHRLAPDWRRRAAEIRKLAGDVLDVGRKRLLQRIARDYDVIAEIAEERRARNRRSTPSSAAA